MKKLIAVFFLCTFMAAVTQAQRDGLGAGIILGEPTGLSAKYWLDDNSAIDGALAWSLEGRSSFHLHATWLWHRFDLIEVDQGDLPVYYGVGGRFKSGGRDRLGVRAPVGLAYHFEDVPIEIFGELAPILDVAPSTRFGLNAAIGGRWYF